MQIPSHVTAFAGIFGSATPPSIKADPEAVLSQPGGGVLMGPEARWAIHLVTINPALGQLLLMVLRDLSPLSMQSDSTLILRITAYDEAAARDTALENEIRDGLKQLDRLARRVGTQGYAEIPERSLRRPLLMQMSHLPLFQRLGVGHSAYAAV